MATGRSRSSSWPRRTTPMPPTPIKPLMRYRPIRSGYASPGFTPGRDPGPERLVSRVSLEIVVVSPSSTAVVRVASRSRLSRRVIPPSYLE